MEKKLKLRLEDLKIQSFEPIATVDHRGTVLGASDEIPQTKRYDGSRCCDTVTYTNTCTC